MRNSFLLTNGKIFTLENEKQFFKVMGVRNGKIDYLGNEIPNTKYDKIINLENSFVFPSLTDSHLHLLYSLVLSSNSFRVCEINSKGVYPNTLDGVKQKIEKYIKDNKNKNFIVANNYIASSILEKRLPTRMELDKWSNNKEIVIMNIDGHSASCSTSLLKKLNLFNENSNGILSGKDYDLNANKITNYISSKLSLSTILDGFNKIQNECIKYGIGKVCALEGFESDKKDFELTLIKLLSRKMDIDVRLYPQYHSIDKINKIFKIQKSPRMGGCSKWELDGSVGSHSASFYKPFKDTSTISDTYYTDKYVSTKVNEINNKKIQFTAHAIGTKAIDQLSKVYDNLENKNNIIHRIDHFEFPSKEAISLAIKNKFAITVQPGFSYIDLRYLHSYENYLDDSIISNQIPLKTLMQNGVYILGGSDSPVQGVNPYLQMTGMINFYNKEQSLTNYEALKTYTTYPNIVLNECDRGILKINNVADFIITTTNLIEANEQELLNAKASKLFLSGKEIKKSNSKLKALLKILFKKPKLI